MSAEEVQRFNSPRGWNLVGFLLLLGVVALWGGLAGVRSGSGPWFGVFLGVWIGFSFTGHFVEATLGDRELTLRSWRDALRGRPGVTYQLDDGIQRARNGECTAVATGLELGRVPVGVMHAIQLQGIDVQDELLAATRLGRLALLPVMCLFVAAPIILVTTGDWWLPLILDGIGLALALVFEGLGSRT